MIALLTASLHFNLDSAAQTIFNFPKRYAFK